MDATPSTLSPFACKLSMWFKKNTRAREPHDDRLSKEGTCLFFKRHIFPMAMELNRHSPSHGTRINSQPGPPLQDAWPSPGRIGKANLQAFAATGRARRGTCSKDMDAELSMSKQKWQIHTPLRFSARSEPQQQQTAFTRSAATEAPLLRATGSEAPPPQRLLLDADVEDFAGTSGMESPLPLNADNHAGASDINVHFPALHDAHGCNPPSPRGSRHLLT